MNAFLYYILLYAHIIFLIPRMLLFCVSSISHVEGMNEDGSFIGLYGKKRQGETTSAGFATLV